jgi:hypothetical protein
MSSKIYIITPFKILLGLDLYKMMGFEETDAFHFIALNFIQSVKKAGVSYFSDKLLICPNQKKSAILSQSVNYFNVA